MKRIMNMVNALLVIVFMLLIFVDTCFPEPTRLQKPPLKNSSSKTKSHIEAEFLKLPLSFEKNEGQTNSMVKYLAHGTGFGLYLTSTETVIVLQNKSASKVTQASGKPGNSPIEKAKIALLRIKMHGANNAPHMSGLDQLQGKYNYFIGNDPKNWRTNVPSFAKVKYHDIYPGIDVVHYGNQRQLESDFLVAPGADPKIITFAFDGAKSLRVDERGDLVVATEGGEINQKKPTAYQVINGIKHEVQCGYAVTGDLKACFKLGEYDQRQPLVIDPVLAYSTYLGGNSPWGNGDYARSISVDATGNAYVTGSTASVDFPITPGAFQTTFASQGLTKVFVTKVNPNGTGLVYSTFLGGTNGGNDEGTSIAVDAAGNAYVTGYTDTGDFPTTSQAFKTSLDQYGYKNAFVTKLNPTGSSLVYSTYLTSGTVIGCSSTSNGSGNSQGNSIAVDTAGSAYVTGVTWAPNFPTTTGSFQPALANLNCALSKAFVTKVNPNGSSLVYSTYLGGTTGSDAASGIAIDANGKAYVTGQAYSTDFPTTPGAFQPSWARYSNYTFTAFVTELSPDGTAPVYSTYLGAASDGQVQGKGIAVDAAGNAYVTGLAGSNSFPTTPGAFQSTPGGSFVSKVNPSGTALSYSSYLSGTSGGIALDSAGNAFVTGLTGPNYTTTQDAFQQTFGGGSSDAFLAKVNSSGTGLLYSSFLGGSDREEGTGVAVDTAGNAYVTGATASVNFPTNGFEFQTHLANVSNNFNSYVAKFLFVQTPAQLSVSEIRPKAGGDTGTVSVVVLGEGFVPGAMVKLARSGEPDIRGSSVSIAAGGLSINAKFDLTGKIRGAWDVVVTNPDGSSKSLPQGFTIEEGRPAQVCVDIIGPPVIRVDTKQTFYVVYRNCGNIDAVTVPIWIAVPNDATFEPGFTITPPTIPDPRGPFDRDSIPVQVGPTGNGEKLIPTTISNVPVGSEGHLPITISYPNAEPFQIRAWASTPLTTASVVDGACVGWPPPGSVQACALSGLNLILNTLGVYPGVGCATAFIKDFVSTATTMACADPFKISGVSEIYVTILGNGVSVGEACFASIIPVVAQLAAAVETVFAFNTWLEQCAIPNVNKVLTVVGVTSLDPNTKAGSTGIGQSQYLSQDEPLNYAVYFENVKTATASAREVVITDQLDINKLDLTTLRLGPTTLGNRFIATKPGTSNLTTDVDLRPEKNLIVRIYANLDQVSGLLTWQFSSIDPSTGQPPEDPLLGFLPPNVNSPEGQGSLLFSVMPKRGLPTGTVISNQAKITFDVNPPMDTPSWINTIDNSKPASHVLSLEPSQPSPSFNVQWAGTDLGAGIKDYTIYVSENGGPFNAWLNNTSSTSGIFSGQTGNTYAFYSVARDQVGNVEDKIPSSESTTTVILDNTPPSTTYKITGTSGTNGWFVSDVGILLTAVDSGSGVKEIYYRLDGGAEIIVPNSTATFTISSEGMHAITYYAVDNIGNKEELKTLEVKVDKTSPKITISGIADGATYLLGAVPPADYAASDTISGVSSRNATLTGGNANGVGTFVYTVTASDNAGNSSTVKAIYQVTYAFSGFLPPQSLDLPFNLGVSIPVKFQLSTANGSYVSTARAKVMVQQFSKGSPVGQPKAATSTSKPTANNEFRYDSTSHQYLYNLDTRKLSIGQWQIQVILDDGTVKTYFISLR